MVLGLFRFHEEWDDDDAATAADDADDADMQKQDTKKTKKKSFRLIGKWRFPLREHVLAFSLAAGTNLHAWSESGGGDGSVASAGENHASAEPFSTYVASAEPKKEPDVIGATTTSTTERRSSGNADGLAHNNNDNDGDNADNNNNNNDNNIVRQQKHRPERPPRFSLAGRASA